MTSTTDAMISALCSVIVYTLAVALIYQGSTRLFRGLIRARLSDGCKYCAYLLQLPRPPYWLLRGHLRRISQTEFTDKREIIQ